MKGVLLVNLGSPISPDLKQVRNYLKEFLMDSKVISIPWLFRFILVNCFIIRSRAATATLKYHKIWQPEGSPLHIHTQKLTTALQDLLPLPVTFGMRYGKPSIHSALVDLKLKGVKEVLILPLFPQYAEATWGSIHLHVTKIASQLEIHHHMLPPFYNRSEYIESLVDIATGVRENAHWIICFHSLPVSHIKKTDFTGSHCLKVPNCCEKPSPVHRVCYRHQCVTTAILFTKTAGISSFSIAFYSHLKTKKWIGPFLEEELLRLAKNGIDKVAVIAPSFVVDCLETIYELGINAKNLFMNAGGKYFYVAPSLNSHEKWVKSLSKWICEFL